MRGTLVVGSSSMAGEVEPFGAKLRGFLLERGITTAIGNPNWPVFAATLSTVGYETLRKAVTGERPPGPKLMEEVAQALDVEPEEFDEYRLWRAQRAFDPREVGLETALANLEAWTRVRARRR